MTWIREILLSTARSYETNMSKCEGKQNGNYKSPQPEVQMIRYYPNLWISEEESIL